MWEPARAHARAASCAWQRGGRGEAALSSKVAASGSLERAHLSGAPVLSALRSLSRRPAVSLIMADADVAARLEALKVNAVRSVGGWLSRRVPCVVGAGSQRRFERVLPRALPRCGRALDAYRWRVRRVALLGACACPCACAYACSRASWDLKSLTVSSPCHWPPVFFDIGCGVSDLSPLVSTGGRPT